MVRLFGHDISFRLPWSVTAAAPNLPPKRTDGVLTEILPPFGTNPPSRPFISTSTDLSRREIHNDPRELWYLALPSKLTPKQVIQILRSALGGDIWQQWQLLSLMLGTWPMLKKCQHEVRSAVASTRYIVRPYAEEGDDPSGRAVEKAKTVRRALVGMRPDPQTDEKGFQGTIYNATDGMLNGLTMLEWMWWERNGEMLPRASAWVHPRQFTFGNDGRIAVFDDMYNRLQYPLAWSPGAPPPAHKFLTLQFMSQSGSSLGTGLMRPLAWYWSAMVFAQDWMLEFAQRYGNPFLDASYAPGTPNDEILKLNGFLEAAGPQGWINHINTAKVDVHPAQSLGTDNPQVKMRQIADEACMLLLLGQTATTQGTAGKLGNDDNRDQVKLEIVESVAGWVATSLTEQLVPSVVMLNYGDEDEMPTIEADFTESVDPLEMAQRDQVLIQGGVPLDYEELCRRHNIKVCEPGDRIFLNGQVGDMGDTDQEVNVGPAPEPEAPEPGGLGGGDESNLEPGEEGEEEPAEARRHSRPDKALRKVLARLSGGELEQLRAKLAKAAAAEKLNGEWEDVKVTVKALGGKAKVRPVRLGAKRKARR